MNWFMAPYYTDTPAEVTVEAKMHSHSRYEIYCFLEGDVEYIVEGRRYVLEPGDIMLLRKGEVHMFDRRSLKRYVRLGIHFNPPAQCDYLDLSSLLEPFLDRPAGKLNHYPARLFPDNQWVASLKKIHDASDPQVRMCHLLALLCDLKERFPVICGCAPAAAKDQAAEIMKYINRNLNEELSLQMLSQKFFVSKSHLQRAFRQSAGTTVWEYITIKRLFFARARIEAGERPSEVYLTCGFRDYATFYRSYKRHFGVSPRAHIPAQI